MEVSQKPFTRKKPDQLVYLELGSGNGGMLLSISEDGFRFRAVSPLRPSGLVPFAFSFDGNRRLQGIGEVEWLEDDGKSGGMRFVEVSADFRSALEQWLALDSSRGKSGREATPAAATPLDTLEKIREELRRGYPQAAAKPSARNDSQEFPAKFSEPKQQEPAGKESEPESQPPSNQPISGSAAESKRRAAQDNSAEQALEQKQIEQKEEHPVFQDASPRAPAERQRPDRTPPPADQPNPETGRARPPAQPSRPFYPPPFTHPEESESTAGTQKPGSVFYKKTVPAPPAPVSSPSEGAVARSSSSASQQATPVASQMPQWREQAHASAESLRRPFRPESRSSRSERPYIPPPVDESFEAAWERAKLTAPPESPHLSRAAAGSIIAVALAVILGALAFNFRRDIGELVIDFGQRISGENHAASPAPSLASENKPESQPTAGSTDSEVPNDNKPDIAPATNSAQPASSTTSPGDSHTAAATGTHDAASGTPHDTSPVARDTGVTHGSTPAAPATGTANRAPANAAEDSAAPPVVPSGTANSTNGLAIGSEPGSGQEEFNAAREMLRGDHRRRNLSRAVDLLWAGVRKGYVPAEVTLADLYRRGDGVEKNCDQAQVLLVAASKKGSPEARQMLEKMAEEGCSE